MSKVGEVKFESMAQGVFVPMNEEFPNVSAASLFASRGQHELSAIATANKIAEKTAQFLSLGSYVRRDYSAGHSNTSLSSTAKGALAVAEGIVDDTAIPESRSERLFGENIRETYFFFKKLRRMFRSK